jgi:dihydrofolate reductase
MRLHDWAFDDPSVSERVYGNLVEETGAVIMGRRSYDNSIEAWGGKGPLGDVPCFVVTHKPPAGSDPVFTFVTDGIESALAKAQEVAAEKRIGLMGANATSSDPAGSGLIPEWPPRQPRERSGSLPDAGVIWRCRHWQ